MFKGWKFVLCAAFAFALVLSACGGGDDDDDGGDGESNTPAASETSDATEPAGGSTPATGGSIDIVSTPPAESDRVWTLEEAQALLDTLPIMPADLDSMWVVQSDTSQDNAAAVAAGVQGAESFERCGRLLSRTLVNFPTGDQIVSRYIGGETVSYFSTFTVYATDAGANDCAAENLERLVSGGCPEIAKAFGQVFIDPNAVSCVPFEFPAIANGNGGGLGLNGKTNAQGMIVDLAIKVVSFRYGNVTVVVGMAAAFDPAEEELAPLVETVLARLEAGRE